LQATAWKYSGALLTIQEIATSLSLLAMTFLFIGGNYKIDYNHVGNDVSSYQKLNLPKYYNTNFGVVTCKDFNTKFGFGR